MPEPKWSGRNPVTDTGGGSDTLYGLTDVTGTPGPGKAPVDDGTQTFPLTRVVTDQDLTTIQTVEWHNLELLNGFTDYGQDFSPARYRLTFNNVVFVEGLVDAGRTLDGSHIGLAIAQLPPECLPGYRLLFNAPTYGGASEVARVDVQPDGQIVYQGFFGAGTGGTGQLFSLCQLTYSVGAWP